MTKEEMLEEIESLKKKVEELEGKSNVNYKYSTFNSSSYAELRRREIDLQDRMWEFSYKNGWKDEYLFDENQYKHYLGYHATDDRVIMLNNYPCLSVNVYFVSRKVAEKAKEIFEYEIKELWEMRANITKGE